MEKLVIRGEGVRPQPSRNEVGCINRCTLLTSSAKHGYPASS